MATFTMKRHDTRPVYRAQLLEPAANDPTNKVPVDLSDATAVKFIMSGDDGIKVNKAAAIEDGPNGRVKYVWVAEDTDTSGDYSIEFEVSWGTDKQTFPSDGYLTISIVDDLA